MSTSSAPVRRLFGSALLALLLAASTVQAADDEVEEPGPIRIFGTLVAQKDPETKAVVYEIEVGDRTYALAGDDAVLAALKKLQKRHVVVEAVPPHVLTNADDHVALDLASPDAVERQAPGAVTGTVRIADGTKKRPEYLLVREDATFRVEARDARRFKAFVGLHVEALALLVWDGREGTLQGVKAVERKLLPGERDPAKGEEAITGSWRGVLTATRVPKGIPGIEPGDFAFHFETGGAKLEQTSGRLMQSYDIVGVRVRTFKRKTRKADVEVAYSFGQGSYAVKLEGTFAPDWKSFTGAWTSGFLGEGTFALTIVDDAAGD